MYRSSFSISIKNVSSYCIFVTKKQKYNKRKHLQYTTSQLITARIFLKGFFPFPAGRNQIYS